MDAVCEMVSQIKALDMETCMTLGMLTAVRGLAQQLFPLPLSSFGSGFAWLGGSRLVLEAQPDDDACQPEVMPELRVVDADDGSDRSLLADGRDVSEPEPSPSGRWVAFTSFRRGATDLFRVRVSDRVVRRLTRTRDINEATPDW